MARSEIIVNQSTANDGNATIYIQSAESWALRMMSTLEGFTYTVGVTLHAQSPVAYSHTVVTGAAGNGSGSSALVTSAAAGLDPVYALYVTWADNNTGTMTITFNTSDKA